MKHQDRARTRPPYQLNDLFRPGPHYQLNACVGPNGGPYDAWDYAKGYFRAGKVLVDDQISRTAGVDLAVYPIAYLFRHSIELALKYLAETLPPLWDEVRTVRSTHYLSDNWAIVREFLSRRKEFDQDGQAVTMVERILKDFLEFDPSGEVFRFPASKAGELHLQDARIINLEVLGAAMGEVYDVFEQWVCTADAMYETQLDERPD